MRPRRMSKARQWRIGAQLIGAEGWRAWTRVRTVVEPPMRKLTVAAIGAVTLAACSGPRTEPLPPLESIEAATLAYANCVNDSALKLAARPQAVEVLAPQAVDGCRKARTEALNLKSVPVFFPTIAEFDSVHLGVARSAIEKTRTVK